jgi:hypothetical protein
VSTSSPPPVPERSWEVAVSWVTTAVFAVTAGIAAIRFSSPWQQVAFVTAMVSSALGCVLFGWAFVRLANRSRTHEFGIGGMFFAAGSAPPSVARVLNGSLAAQTLIAIVTAAVRPFTTLAFGCLVPLVAVACTGLWCARYGTFPERHVDPREAAARSRRVTNRAVSTATPTREGLRSRREMGQNERHG